MDLSTSYKQNDLSESMKETSPFNEKTKKRLHVDTEDLSASYKHNNLSESMRETSPINDRPKKRLLVDTEMKDVGSPVKSSPKILSVEHTSSSPLPDCSFNLFRIEKTSAGTPSEDKLTTPTHSRNVLSDLNTQQESHSHKSPCGEGPSSKLAVQEYFQDQNIIGDFSKSCLLPVIMGKPFDVMCIAPGTVATLLKTNQIEKFKLIDCRYPYEYRGGHIMGAKNIFQEEDGLKEIFNIEEITAQKEDKNILIFYCEFSSLRGPDMYRFVRGHDRELNKDSFPNLFYPEMYVMQGGYKAFFREFQKFCEPQGYTTMLDKEFSQDLLPLQEQSKVWHRILKQDRRKVIAALKLQVTMAFPENES